MYQFFKIKIQNFFTLNTNRIILNIENNYILELKKCIKLKRFAYGNNYISVVEKMNQKF